MNVRLQKYKANRLKGMNQYTAAIRAGYNHNYARQACRIEKLAKVSLQEQFEKAGLTDEEIIRFALDGMYNATKLFGKDAVEHPDWQIKHRFFDSAMQLMNKIPKDSKDGSQTHYHLTVINFDSSKDNSDSSSRVFGIDSSVAT